MKKTLVALAALAATGAFAQSTVTMYGSIDVAYVTKTHTSGTGIELSKVSGVGEGFNAGNRIGFRGTEDLGSGMKANFVIEQGINITNGQLFSTRAAASGQQYDGITAAGNMPNGAYSTSTNRQSYVGLEGGFGQIRLGYQYTNLYQLSTNSGYMNGSEQPGADVAHLMSQADFGGTRANSITYLSPVFSGVQVTLQHGAGGGREDVSFSAANSVDGKSYANTARNSIMVKYDNGPLSAALAYTKYSAQTSAVAAAATTTGNLNNFSVAAITAAAATDFDATLTQLGARYDFGVARLTGTYNKGSRDEKLTATAYDYKSQQIGLEGVFGKARPFLQIGSGTITAANVSTNEFKTQQLGIRYDLSKRTMAYLMTGSTKDDAAVAQTATGTVKREATALGIYHSF